MSYANLIHKILLQKLLRWSVVFFLLLPSGVQQDGLSRFGQRQMTLINTELTRIFHQLKWGDDQREEILNNLEPIVGQFKLNGSATIMGDFFFCAPEPFRKALWKELREKTPEELLPQLNQHIEKTDSFLETLRNESVQCVMMSIDNCLLLSEEQHSPMEEIVRKRWQLGSDLGALKLVFRPDAILIGDVLKHSHADLEKILSESQLLAFHEFEQLNRNPSQLWSNAHASGEFDFAEPRECFQKLIGTQLIGLDHAVDLSEPQLSKIRLAFKGAVETLENKWRENTLQDEAHEANVTEVPLVIQLRNEEILERTLKQTLTDRQFEIYIAEKLRRRRAFARCCLCGQVLTETYLRQNIRLTSEQLEQIIAPMVEELLQQESVGFRTAEEIFLRRGNQLIREMTSKDRQG